MLETMGKKVINKYLDGVAGKLSLAHRLADANAASPQLTLSHQDWTVAPEVQALLQELAAAAADMSASSSSSGLVDKVLQLLEDFRQIMKTGRADMNIPVLEPAVIERMPVQIKLPPFE